MYEAKTKPTDQRVADFLKEVTPEKRKKDALKLLEIFERVTGFPGVLWGSSIVGFGKYAYTYASGHSGEAPLVGFSPRKSAMSLYFATGDEQREALLEKFGKHTSGKACVYVKKIEDVDLEILEALILQSIDFLLETYPQSEEK
jgi:hypothetical protein